MAEAPGTGGAGLPGTPGCLLPHHPPPSEEASGQAICCSGSVLPVGVSSWGTWLPPCCLEVSEAPFILIPMKLQWFSLPPSPLTPLI